MLSTSKLLDKTYMYARRKTSFRVIAGCLLLFVILGIFAYICIRAIMLKQISENVRTLKFNLVLVQMTLTSVIFAATLIITSVYNYVAIKLTEHDMLTGLPNHAATLKYGAKLERRMQLNRYAAAILNIRNFSSINQKYGYTEGNNVLIRTANVLTEMMPTIDFVSRIGNDNFFVLVPTKNVDAFIDLVKQRNPISYNDAREGDFPAPMRCGIYHATVKDTIERLTSLCLATISYNHAYGEDSVVIYDDELFEGLMENGNIIASYRKALNHKEFKVMYQPKVSTSTEILCGAEALVRWFKDDRFITPDYFIPLLEHEKLVIDLDKYVLATVCEDIKHWQYVGLQPVTISVNFSKLHLDNPDFADDVLRIIDDYGVSHQYISIELTESSGYTNLGALKTFVARMASEGISTAMDDFGTGFSSLSLLGDIKMQEIKMDKSFVDRVLRGSTESDKFVTNVIHMVKDLNRLVICEGVETLEQLEFIKEAGCDIVQGFYYDKPLPTLEFEKRLINPHYPTNKNKI